MTSEANINRDKLQSRQFFDFLRPRDVRKNLLHFRFSTFVIFAAVILGAATYAALSDTPPLGNDPDTLFWLLNADLVILLTLVTLIAKRAVGLLSGRKRGIAGSHLQVRLVYTFSLLAAVPAIIMTIFSLFFFHYGVQTWFSARVQTAVHSSYAVAQAYLEEHKQIIKSDTMAMASDMDQQAAFLFDNKSAFEKVVNRQARLRSLSEAIVFDSSGRIFARSGLTFSLEFEAVPEHAMEAARAGDVVVMTGGNDDRVRALVKLNNYVDTYLFVGRMVDPQVLSYLADTQEAAQDYKELESRYSDLQLSVTLIFVVVGLVLLMIAIWFGLILARQLVGPIITLINTTDKVRAGDLSVRVPEEGKLEEFDYLAQAFNRMTAQLQQQHEELMEANRQVDHRRKLIETVLKGVSSGVIGVDRSGAINLANSSAEILLAHDQEAMTGRDVREMLPEVGDLLTKAHERPNKTTQAEIIILRGDQSKRTFLVRVAVELIGEEDVGAILTFDDITELQATQKKAAWSDVARRIAHEIKNPLTPIQLSAERLRKKYKDEIKNDPETFLQCTDTIVKHVEDIGRMVDEFSAFARMPDPKMAQENLYAAVSDAIFLQKQAYGSISFDVDFQKPKEQFICAFDGQQIRQALNNLLQNAVDSLIEAATDDARIGIYMTSYGDDELAVVVSDNGVGFPKNEDPTHLTEPYVTHKTKGTGLGLAIVQKIMEDHEGHVVMGAPDWLKKDEAWQDLGGAVVVLTLPRVFEDIKEEEDKKDAA